MPNWKQDIPYKPTEPVVILVSFWERNAKIRDYGRNILQCLSQGLESLAQRQAGRRWRSHEEGDARMDSFTKY